MKVREILEENGLECDELKELITIDDMDEALIGISEEDDRLVYSYDRMIQIIMERDDCDYHEAADCISYDIIRGLTFMNDNHKPIIMYELRKE